MSISRLCGESVLIVALSCASLAVASSASAASASPSSSDLSAASASAIPSAAVSGSATCTPDGSYTIVWNVQTADAAPGDEAEVKVITPQNEWIYEWASHYANHRLPALMANASFVWTQIGVSGSTTEAQVMFQIDWHDFSHDPQGVLTLKGDCTSIVPPIDPPVTPPIDPPVTPPVTPPVDPPVDPPVTPPVDPPVTPPVDPPVDPPVTPPVDPPVTPPTTVLPPPHIPAVVTTTVDGHHAVPAAPSRQLAETGTDRRALGISALMLLTAGILATVRTVIARRRSAR